MLRKPCTLCQSCPDPVHGGNSNSIISEGYMVRQNKDNARSKCCRSKDYSNKGISVISFRALSRSCNREEEVTIPTLLLRLFRSSKSVSDHVSSVLLASSSVETLLIAASSTLSWSSISPQNCVSLCKSVSSSFIVTHEHLLTMLDQELHRPVLGLRILHFSRQTLWSHHSRCEHDRDILTRHQIVCLLVHNPRQMEYQHF